MSNNELPNATDDSMTFLDLGLCSEMTEAANSLGWDFPTQIQRQTIPSALEGDDICGMAVTGSGKTGAYILPIIHQLLDHNTPLYALALLPTRELAVQVAEVARNLGKKIGLRVLAVTGGVEEKAQLQLIKKGPHIIVATPGRLVQILRENPSLDFTSIKVLVFDEADRMLSDSFMDEVDHILKRISKQRQTLLFSATMPEDIEHLAKISLVNPKTFNISERHQTAQTLTEYFIVSPTGKKETTLYVLLKAHEHSSIIVFTGSCKSAQIIDKMLRNLRMSSIMYHGQLPQIQRQQAVSKFREGQVNILVATNVAARGLDVPHVDIVINYELPEQHEEYVHRVGRAGRATRCGMAITMITANDILSFRNLEVFLKKKLDRMPLDDGEIQAAYYDVEIARKQSVDAYKDFKKKKVNKLKGKK